MFLIMRWSICPCEACYERLPEWVRPVAEQLDIPHTTPFMRKRLAASSTPVRFDEFFVPYTTTLSLNWPHPTSQVLLPASPAEGGGVKMNPVFESHLRGLESWSLGADFQRAFPDLVVDVRIHGAA
ncbi:hypothetical protein LTR35_018345 [Friedmanniomyces endolithicus]|nr:hypothetical protein LTR35_018345 [Friedmanniomyces endolithicus]